MSKLARRIASGTVDMSRNAFGIAAVSTVLAGGSAFIGKGGTYLLNGALSGLVGGAACGLIGCSLSAALGKPIGRAVAGPIAGAVGAASGLGIWALTVIPISFGALLFFGAVFGGIVGAVSGAVLGAMALESDTKASAQGRRAILERTVIVAVLILGIAGGVAVVIYTVLHPYG